MKTFKHEEFRTPNAIWFRIDGGLEVCVVCGNPLEFNTYAHHDCWDSLTESSQHYVVDASKEARTKLFPPGIRMKDKYVVFDRRRIKTTYSKLVEDLNEDFQTS